MQETELHDLSDDADYVASQQQQHSSKGSRSSSWNESDKRSVGSEPDEAEIVYLKENVTIHPTQYASERIRGRLRLIKQRSSLFMTWIPYKASWTGSLSKGQNSNTRLSDRERHVYTIRAVPLTDVRSIRRHTPTFGWQYIIVVLSSGLAFPPLYFYNGGVREFLATLKQHVFLVRSADDANVFLVNDFQDPLQRTLSSLELPRVPVTNVPSTSSLTSSDPSNEENPERTDDRSSSASPYSGRQRKKVHDPARDLSIQVLEKFSLVTKFARETTSHLFRESHGDSFSANDRNNQIQFLPSNTHDSESNDMLSVPDEILVTSDPTEVLTTFWFQLKPQQNIDPDSHTEKHYVRKKIIVKKLTPEWEVLCLSIVRRIFPMDWQSISPKDGHFVEFDKLSLVWGKSRQPPLGSEEWATFLDSEGRVIDSKALKKRIFYGGVEHALRKEVWKFLLGYHEYDSTYAEREYLVLIKKSEYETLKSQWQNISPAQAKRFSKFRERKGLIDKDVVRTDRSVSFYDGDDNPNVMLLRDILLTYSFYNFDLGYCQGMSDLLSPILFVMKDESESFWCFVALMERLGPNFNRDQNGMHSQLFALSKLVELLDSPLHNYFKQNDCLNYFFCFRWVLIQFKREFEYEKTMSLWEVLWTHYLCEHLHLYVCVAILKRHRKKIMGEQMDFDTLLKFINELSGHIDLDATLRDAEALCLCAGENGAACIPPGTPPSLQVDETGLMYAQQDDS